MLSRCRAFLLLISCCTLLNGCVASLLGSQSSQNFSEQLYIDARLDFAIQHPLDWKRLRIPVSSPQYRADTVRWRINDVQQNRDAGEMIIRSLPSNGNKNLPDLLSAYLAAEPELKTGKVEEITLPSGPALKLLGHDDNLGRLTIVIKGQVHDFIISLASPSNRFEELLPIFQDVISSFVEVVRPTDQPE